MWSDDGVLEKSFTRVHTSGSLSAITGTGATEGCGMAAPDNVFLQTYAWYKASIDHLLGASALAAADQAAVKQLI